MASNNLTFHMKPDTLDSLKERTRNVFKYDDTLNVLADATRDRTYSRIMENGEKESWYDTLKRVTEGTYHIMKQHTLSNGKLWDNDKAQKSSEEMFNRMIDFKFLPPGRGLWCMGTPLLDKNLSMALNNCAMISTKDMQDNPSRVFTVLMDMSMCGTGCGFDTKGANTVRLYRPDIPANQLGIQYHDIEDSREGWVKSLELLLDSYFYQHANDIVFNYNLIRKKGEKLKVFGGTSSGPQPLIDMHGNIYKVLEREESKTGYLSSTGIVDICNLIGVCVVSGGVRRTALIAFGEEKDKEFLDLKNYEKNPHRANYGWTSNNTVFAKLGQDYTDIQSRILNNGEPGLAWLENMRAYSRLCDAPDYKDRRVVGGNPCLEQSLESYEVCTLVENFISNHKTLDDFLITLKYSFLYAKVVTLLMTHIPETNEVMKVNRRIGSSLSGIAQFLSKNSIHHLKHWCEVGYREIQKWDKIYSEWLDVPMSIKLTSIKPSGTVSLLAGATPGVHFPYSRYYIRRMRVTTGTPILDKLKKEGYYMEPDVFNKEHTMVVEFPIDIGECKTLDDVTMFEQLELVAFMQQYWADNQVSCTITFKPDEGKHIAAALNTYQYRLKGISFLPKDDNSYPQMPYEKITQIQYVQELESIKRRKQGDVDSPIKRRRVDDAQPELYCDGGRCVL